MFGHYFGPQADTTARPVSEEKLPPLRLAPRRSIFGTASTNRETALVQLKAAIEDGRVYPRGEFWNKDKSGTAFGIILEGEAPKFFPDKFALPMRLCFAGEAVFRGLPHERSLAFSLELFQGLVDHHSTAARMWERCAVFVLNELADSAANAQQAELIAMAAECCEAIGAGKQPHNKLPDVRKFAASFKEGGELVYVVTCLINSIADDTQSHALEAAQGLRYTAKLFEAQATSRALSEKVEASGARQLGEQASVDFFEQVARHLLANFTKH
jgi:hypothetical protein